MINCNNVKECGNENWLHDATILSTTYDVPKRRVNMVIKHGFDRKGYQLIFHSVIFFESTGYQPWFGEDTCIYANVYKETEEIFRRVSQMELQGYSEMWPKENMTADMFICPLIRLFTGDYIKILCESLEISELP